MSWKMTDKISVEQKKNDRCTAAVLSGKVIITLTFTKEQKFGLDWTESM